MSTDTQNTHTTHNTHDTHDTVNNHGAMALRLAFGSVLLAHGLMKVMVFGFAGTVGYFASIGLPAITAYLDIFGEVVGGIAILLGSYTRLAAFLSIPILMGASMVHSGNGWVFSNPGGGWEYPVLLIVLAGIVTLQGPGSFALGGTRAIDVYVPVSLRD